MYRYRLKTTIHNRHQVRKLNPKRLMPWAVTMCVGTVVACGFIYVCWLHIEAVQIRQESEALRRQKASLDRAERRLTDERNRKLSPETLELVAGPFGLTMPRPQQTVSLQLEKGMERR